MRYTDPIEKCRKIITIQNAAFRIGIFEEIYNYGVNVGIKTGKAQKAEEVRFALGINDNK